MPPCRSPAGAAQGEQGPGPAPLSPGTRGQPCGFCLRSTPVLGPSVGRSRGLQVHSKESPQKGSPQPRPGQGRQPAPVHRQWTRGRPGRPGCAASGPRATGNQHSSCCVALIRALDHCLQRGCHPPRREAAATAHAELSLDRSLGRGGGLCPAKEGLGHSPITCPASPGAQELGLQTVSANGSRRGQDRATLASKVGRQPPPAGTGGHLDPTRSLLGEHLECSPVPPPS